MIRLLADSLGDIRSRFSSRGFTAAMVAACVVPALVAVVLIAALAPALDAQTRIPVAVVNLDEGIEGDGESAVNSGAELVDSLADSAELAWEETDEDAALAGLRNGTYALVFEIPKDYSRKVASVDGSDPTQAQIQIISSGSQNVLATRTGSAALKQVQSRLRADLGEQYMLRVLNSVNGQASTLSLTADGAVVLDSAYDALEQGTGAIAEGLAQTASGTDALASGVDTIAAGVTAAGTGASMLADTMDATAGQLEPLVAGAEGVSTGLTTVASQLDPVGSGLVEAGNALQGLADELGTSALSMREAMASASQIGGAAASLSAAHANMASAQGDVSAAGEGLASAVTSGRDAYEAVQTDAAALAMVLSSASDPSAESGIAQDLAQLDAEYDAVAEELALLLQGSETASQDEAAAAGAEGADEVVVDRAQLQALADKLDELATRRSELAQRVEGAASDASALSAQAASTAESLGSADAARDELEHALEAYDASAGEATAASAQVVELIPQVTAPVAESTGTVMLAHLTLDQLAPTIGAAGEGVSVLSEQLSSDGLLGQGAAAVAAGSAAVPQAMSMFSSAVDQLGQGNAALGEALGGVSVGVSSLGDGLSALAGVQSQLSSGVGQLREGQQTITDTLSVAGDELGEVASARDERAEVAASPVTFTTSTLDRTDGASAGIAPVALGIVLWTGALAASYVLPAIDRRAVLAGRGAASVLASYLLCAAFCLVQAAVAAVLLTLLAGISPVSAAGLAALCALASLAFAAVAQALRTAFGRFAAAASLSLLLLQFLCAGAILPAAFTSGIFQALGQVLPVPALMEGLRGAMAGSLANFGSTCAVLAAWLVICLAASLLAATRLRSVRPERTFA